MLKKLQLKQNNEKNIFCKFAIIMKKLLIQIFVVAISLISINAFALDHYNNDNYQDLDILSEKELNDLSREYVYNDAEKALECATKALEKATANKNIEEVAYAKNNMGIIYFNWGVYEYAIAYFIEAFQAFKEVDNSEGISKVMNNFGVCMNTMNRPDIALPLFQLSLKIQKTYRNYENIADLWSNISLTYSYLNNDSLLFKYNQQALDLSNKIGYSKGKANALNNFGVCYEQIEMLDSALHYYTEAYLISKESQETYQTYIFLQNQASILDKMGKHKEALKILHYGFDKVISLNVPAAEQSYSYLFSRIYHNLGDYKNAYEYFQKFFDKKEEIMGEQVKQKFNQMLVNFQKEQYQRELNLLNEKIQLRKGLQIALFITVLILALVIALLIVYVKMKTALNRRTEELRKIEKEFLENQLELQETKAKKEKRELQQTISQKERELVSASLNLVTKSEAIVGVQTFLDELIESGQINKKSDIYKQINELINNSHRTDTMWNDFFLHFESVYPDFYSKLQAKYPQLNNNDLKFCAYLKINLGNKDLSRIYNITEHSVKIKKYRLRRKLKLDKGEDFLSALLV